MSTTNNVVVSGSSIINFPNFSGQHAGNRYIATASPDKVTESSFVFGKDAIVVFEFGNLTSTRDNQNGFSAYEGEISGNSRLLKITVYENATAYQAGTAAYYYQPQNADGTNLSNSNDRYGDTYLGFQTNAFASDQKPPVRLNGYTGEIPRLGQELFIMPSVNLYDQLLVKKESFTYSNVTDVDYNGDGYIDPNSPEKGNGFFDGRHGNPLVEDEYLTPPPICFVHGSFITTRRGDIAVETLVPGDEVLTADHSYQPIRWIGVRRLSRSKLEKMPKLRPVLITAGALGHGLPRQDLYLSQQHRVLLRSKVVARLSSATEALVAAKHLVDGRSIRFCQDLPEVVYYHLLFDRHEVIFANGAPTESLYTGPMALRSLPEAAREEILTLFPELAIGEVSPPARIFMNGKTAHKLTARLQKNHIDLLEPAA